MPSCLFPDIFWLIIAVKCQRILVHDVTSEPGEYPLSCLYKHNKRILGQNLENILFLVFINMIRGY